MNKVYEQISINNKDTSSYERELINEGWYGDSCVGPYLMVGGKKQRTYILALIDHHSRKIIGIDIIFSESLPRTALTPASKLTLEKWFRILRAHWMASLNMSDFNSLEELRASLLAYVQFYNQSVHSSLNGSSPQDHFYMNQKDMGRIEKIKHGGNDK